MKTETISNELSTLFIKLPLLLLTIFLTGCASQRYDKLTLFPSFPANWETRKLVKPFAWPTQGKIVREFSSGAGSSSMKGILIAPRGEGILAAESGRVSFVHPHFKSYGATIIIEHSLEFATVYSGNSEILVQPGDWVDKKQVIAKIRPSNGEKSLFYFELRRNSVAQNPLSYLG